MRYYLDQIVNGGQTGVEIAALKAAKEFNFRTGGFMAGGCLTTDGQNKKLLRQFGLKEHTENGYVEQLAKNACVSDGTICISDNWDSLESRFILKYTYDLHRLCLKNKISNLLTFQKVFKWLCDNNIRTLHVCGDNEKVHPGVFNKVHQYLRMLFDNLKYEE